MALTTEQLVELMRRALRARAMTAERNVNVAPLESFLPEDWEQWEHPGQAPRESLKVFCKQCGTSSSHLPGGPQAQQVTLRAGSYEQHDLQINFFVGACSGCATVFWMLGRAAYGG